MKTKKKPWMRAFARWHARLPKSHVHTLCPRCRKPSDLGFCSTCGLRFGLREAGAAVAGGRGRPKKKTEAQMIEAALKPIRARRLKRLGRSWAVTE